MVDIPFAGSLSTPPLRWRLLGRLLFGLLAYDLVEPRERIAASLAGLGAILDDTESEAIQERLL